VSLTLCVGLVDSRVYAYYMHVYMSVRLLHMFCYITAGRPVTPINITPFVLPAAQLARQLYAVMPDKHEWLQWLARHCLIRNNVDCRTCRQPMALVARQECNDGFSWRCRHCNTRCSIRTGSFFANCESS